MANFFGGLAQGLQGGGFDAAVDEFVRRHQARKVAAALANANGGGGAPPPPPAANGNPMGGLAALGGGGANAPAPPPAAPPSAGPAPAPAAPPPQPMPGAPTGQPGAHAPTGMSVDPTLADPIKEGQSLITNLWKNIKAANPHADPMTIMQAVNSQIDEIKGVAPITKSAMQGQLSMMHETIRAQEFDQREIRLWNEHSQKLELAYKANNWKEAVAEENSRFKGEMVKVAQDRASVYGEATEFAHEDRQAANKTRLDVANIGAVSRMSVAELKEQGLDDRSIDALKGKHGAAITSNLAKIMAANPGADVDTAIQSLEQAYGSGAGGGQGKPAPKAGRKSTATVNGPDDIRKLPQGTPWVSADGKRHGVAP